jgi:hypothetical protein
MSIVTHQDRACIVACFISSIVVREPSDQKAKDKQPSSVPFAAVAAPLFFFEKRLPHAHAAFACRTCNLFLHELDQNNQL